MKLDQIYLITDRNTPPSGDFLGALRAALEGGVRFLQFREKDLPPRERLGLGEKVMALAKEFDATVIVNASVDLAEALGASGVHLGKSTLSVEEVRGGLRYRGLIGYSAHNGQEVVDAFEAGADFAVLSPVFETRSKISAGPFLGLAGFRDQMDRVKEYGHLSPVFALGGIGAENTADCLRAGAFGVALIGGILGVADPAAAALEIRRALSRN